MAKMQTYEEHEMRVGATKPANQLIYGASIASILLSVMMVRRNLPLANFFGLWAPTLLGLGILFKENELLARTKHSPAY